MDETALQRSLSLDQVAKALAQWTVARHAETDESLPARYGDQWRAHWVRDVQQRINLLSQSLAVERPEVFAESIRWARAAFNAREMSADDLRASLACTRAVIAKELPAPLADPAVACIDTALPRLDGAAEADAVNVGLDRPHGQVTLRYLEALLECDAARAEDLIVAAAEGGAPVGELYLDVLQPALTEIGRLWHLGEVSVYQEHFATAATERVMSRLRGYFPQRDGGSSRCMVATAISGDFHSVGIRMVAEFFEMDGWKAVCLGANTPDTDLIEALRECGADLVALSVATFYQLRAMGQVVRAIRADEALAKLAVIVGGAPFMVVPDLWRSLGADGSAPSAAAAVQLGDRLVPIATGG